MKILFRLINRTSFDMELGENLTIGEVKIEVAKHKGEEDYPVSALKLIYAGKVLNDSTQLLKDVGIVPSKFVVVLVSGKKPPATTSDPLAFLRDQAEFTALAQLLYGEPKLLEAAKEVMEEYSLGLLQLITRNQSSFIRLLNDAGMDGVVMEKVERSEKALELVAFLAKYHILHVEMGYVDREVEAALRFGGGNLVLAAEHLLLGLPLQTLEEIEVTEEDRDAIARLEVYGFLAGVCLEAFIVCDKDVETAVSFICEAQDQGL